MKYLLTIFATLITLTAMATKPTREHIPINDNWRFYFAEELDSSNAEYVTLPHTWNDHDSGSGEEYRRTSANYIRTTWIPSEWQGRRIFLRFGGVQSVADVFINGAHVGEHRGGFTGFTIEITDAVKYGADNYLRVVASNAHRSDILPTSSDLDLCGGIYREVELIVTPQSVISPLFYSSDGVIIEQHHNSEIKASGVAHIHLSTPEDHLMVHLRIVAANGYEVSYRSAKATKINGEKVVKLPYEISHPELWSPERPTLYTVEASIGSLEEPIDVVRIETGFRSISISADNRLSINGQEVEVRGVNLAHDRSGVATAIDKSDIDNDLALIEEIGANAIRSLSGPHDDHLYDECDHRGILSWVDIPFTRSTMGFSDICYYGSEPFQHNGMEQLKEVVYQNYNHPSVVMWGIFSLVSQRGSDINDYIGRLNEASHTIDPSRPTAACSNVDGDINFITDLIALRQDVGWTRGSAEDVAIWCEQLRSNKSWEQLHTAVCYGEEGVPTHTTETLERAKRGSYLLPERRQRVHHERYIEILEREGIFWGIWLDNMFDYASSRRPYGMNQTGLVGYDHTTKKDIFYLYRALWNSDVPTLHITDKGWRVRQEPQQQFTIYSSVGAPHLTINGTNVNLKEVGHNVWRSEEIAIEGEAEVVATSADGKHRDSTTIRVVRR
jgi:beta-galactosidase